jgi:hypothetical protein
MIGKRSVYNLIEPKGATLLNLGRFSAGSLAAVDYIPKDTRGFYAWFRSYDYPEDPELFVERLLQDISAPKFAPRRGFVSPYHQVEIASGGDMTQSRKDALKRAIRDPEFFASLRAGLFHSILFQSPLYVGKAINLRKRISTHLSASSPLRERLACVGLNLDHCLLLIFPHNADDGDCDLSPSYEVGIENDEIENDEIEEDLSPEHSLDHEVLLEEVFSRLFSPQFTLRIG